MGSVPKVSVVGRLRLVLVLAVVCLSVVPAGTAVASPQLVRGVQETPQPQPPGGQAPLNTFIDPALLASVQQSIVGLVVVWEEPADPFALGPVEPVEPVDPVPVFTICTGWFDSPTTIVTAGHCVDPEEGRAAIERRNGPPVDPGTGQPLPTTEVRPEPERTVWAFQPRELPGAVITSPVIVRVDSFRSADEGDTAKLEMYGLPPATPLAVAPTAPRIGETVTSIGFPGLNIEETDGVNLDALTSGGKTPAEVLQDSRLQPVNTSGTITARQFREGVAVYQVNSDLAEGTSGGPTINSRGEVYGINSRMTVPFLGQNFNVITDTGMLRDFLGHGPVQPGTDPSSTPSRLTSGSVAMGSAPAAAWIIIALLGGAVLGGLGTWFGMRSRRQPAGAGGTTAAAGPET